MVKDSYGKPWYRMGTFFLGTILALSYESLKKFKPHRLVSFLLSFFAFIWILFGLWYSMWLPQIYNWKNNPRNPENYASQKTQGYFSCYIFKIRLKFFQSNAKKIIQLTLVSRRKYFLIIIFTDGRMAQERVTFSDKFLISETKNFSSIKLKNENLQNFF